MVSYDWWWGQHLSEFTRETHDVATRWFRTYNHERQNYVPGRPRPETKTRLGGLISHFWSLMKMGNYLMIFMGMPVANRLDEVLLMCEAGKVSTI